MDYAPLIEKRRIRLEELEQEIADPSLFDDRKRAEELMREHRRTVGLMDIWMFWWIDFINNSNRWFYL